MRFGYQPLARDDRTARTRERVEKKDRFAINQMSLSLLSFPFCAATFPFPLSSVLSLLRLTLSHGFISKELQESLLLSREQSRGCRLIFPFPRGDTGWARVNYRFDCFVTGAGPACD